jgi:deoxyguanosine kinase
VRLPDLIVYLRAETSVLMQRIALRDRTYERNMEVEYIEALNRAYDDHFTHNYQGPPVLTVDSNGLDFVKHEKDLKHIEGLVREALKGAMRQAEMPLGDD